MADRVYVAATLRGVQRSATAAGEPRGAGEELLDRRLHVDVDRARAGDGRATGSSTSANSRSPGASSDEIRRRLEFLSAVGLDYLSLERSAATLSGGEAQRIRLATQIGSKLRGVLYVLDEPSIGLHPRDNNRLLETLTHLRDMGNTVLVVEHDAETIERADYVIDLGPGAGRLGGELVAAGEPGAIAQNAASLTGQYLSGALEIAVPAERRKPGDEAARDPRAPASTTSRTSTSRSRSAC